jgi:hypothetical protein
VLRLRETAAAPPAAGVLGQVPGGLEPGPESEAELQRTRRVRALLAEALRLLGETE